MIPTLATVSLAPCRGPGRTPEPSIANVMMHWGLAWAGRAAAAANSGPGKGWAREAEQVAGRGEHGRGGRGRAGR